MDASENRGTDDADSSSSPYVISLGREIPPEEYSFYLSESVTCPSILFLDDVPAVHVQVRGLSVSLNTAPSWLEPATYPDLICGKFDTAPRSKTLLHSVAADMRPGTLTAIIGGSGSGKTTLLNAMAERTTSWRLNQEGAVTFNGQLGVHSARHAYVMQQDSLVPTLTVRETLRYAAALRLPATTSREHRNGVVEQVLCELGLNKCADTRIGNSRNRGCSAGEKKRVSIGVQLLANPSVLFLDEPTSGLDATSAHLLMHTLKSLASQGRTVITTLHQPRSEIWHLLDNLVVLSEGAPMYAGCVLDCLHWFQELGFTSPQFVNPADFVIDLTAIDKRTPELEAESTDRLNGLKSAWAEESTILYRSEDPDASYTGQKPVANTQHAGPFLRQLRLLTVRTLKVTHRDALGKTATWVEAIFMGLLTGYIFNGLGRDQMGIRSREGGLYIATVLQGYFILLLEVYRMTIDIRTFDNESADGCVDALPFVLSRRLAHLLTEDLLVPAVYSALVYFPAGFQLTSTQFLTFLAITVINHSVCVSCAMTSVVAARRFARACLLANLVYTLQILVCGMLIQVNTMSVYVRWLRWISFAFYAFSSYAGNEFQGNFYECPLPGGPLNPACQPYSGDFVMESLGFPSNWVARPIIILTSFLAFFTILSVLGLRFLKADTSISRSQTSDTDLSAGKEKMTERMFQETGMIDLGLDGLALVLDKRNGSGKWQPKKVILYPVTTTFRAGVLSVVMGPSGSGKTSLLNAMALRLRNTVRAKYRTFGHVTFNGSVPSDSVIRSVCSYVCQDDDALLPSLTVRETLRFAAGLRLPSFMRTDEKNRVAEDVIMKMGLKDCADKLIGSDTIQGISRGEKRRVSIGIQILTNPRILLLDEPTSGLDAFTASSVMEVLQGLANEGRTVIMTVHQARSDLFHRFGDVVLLASDGLSVFLGPASQMLEHFSHFGYNCPTQTNPADFGIDMVTINEQQDEREAKTRDRVQKLIEEWTRSYAEGRWQPFGDAVCGIPEGGEANNNEDGKDHTIVVQQGNAPLNGQNGPSSPRLSKAKLLTPAELAALIGRRPSILTTLPLLVQRAFINIRRQPQLVMARIRHCVGLAVLLAIFFAPIGNDYFAVQTRMGFVQAVGAFYLVGMLQNAVAYPFERDVFYRENDDGAYGAGAFLASYTLVEVPLELLSCMVVSVLSTFAVGLPRNMAMYGAYSIACFGLVSCGESLGIMFNTLFGRSGFPLTLMGFVLSIAMAMAGVFSIDMPRWLQAVNFLSPIRYATRAVAPLSLRDVQFTCTDGQRLPVGRCPIETGQQVLELYGFDVDPWVNAACLAACIVVYRLMAWALLKMARARWASRR
ncbi:uncharacterized protein UV8b_07116 [Ustilaginoidea virens]|uniref:ABC transporter domain-containing protein n=1 Tax=Ustilaginoidea virens TaxID=1159556 RepID=A0A8E5HWV3_USTVR|nr:uncharacterized protein UV8b_07116 [Ustilaginoidea virens]QUC22875.1 hypothetical protein UV8b_07116 [Ustilaginoidea virens]